MSDKSYLCTIDKNLISALDPLVAESERLNRLFVAAVPPAMKKMQETLRMNAPFIESMQKLQKSVNSFSALGKAIQDTYTDNIFRSAEMLAKSLSSNSTLSLLGKSVQSSAVADYLKEFSKRADFSFPVNASDFKASDEYNRHLNQCLENIAAINDKQPVAECTINSQTVEEFKNLSLPEKTECVNNGVQAVLNFLQILVLLLTINNNFPIDVNVVFGSNNTLIQSNCASQSTNVNVVFGDNNRILSDNTASQSSDDTK